jgi:hypothetical protein
MGNECPSKPIQMPTPMITAPKTMIIKSVINHLGMRFSRRCGIAYPSMLGSLHQKSAWAVNTFTCNPIVTSFGLFVMASRR